MKRFAFLAAVLSAVAIPAGAHDKPKPDDPKPPPQVVVQKDHRGMCDGGLRPVFCVAGVVGAAVGLYYVLKDDDTCPKAAPPEQPKPLGVVPPLTAVPPAHPPTPAKPKRKPSERACEIPGAKAKPVTKAGVELQPGGVIAATVGHRF